MVFFSWLRMFDWIQQPQREAMQGCGSIVRSIIQYYFYVRLRVICKVICKILLFCLCAGYHKTNGFVHIKGIYHNCRMVAFKNSEDFICKCLTDCGNIREI